MKIKYPISDPHTLSVEEITKALATDLSTGLGEVEVENRSKVFGPNIFKTEKQKSIFVMLIKQFQSPIVYLLLFATVVALVFQHRIEAISIFIVILLNAIIGFLMELQARNSMRALKKMDLSMSRVLRDARIQEVPSENLVPGDIILIEAGDIIPGDARIVESNELQCDESSLTGESLPIQKIIFELPTETALGDQVNMIFKGASVTDGNGKAVITGISQNTQLGIITKLVETSKENETPLDKQIKILSKKLIWVTLGLTAVFAITGIIQGKSWLLILETSIALAVAAFPEGLPIVSTVALSYGMLLMARRNAVVKKLSAVETLGSTNIILTDKTGTLTENKVYVDTIAFIDETIKVTIRDNILIFENDDFNNQNDAFSKLRMVSSLCNNAYKSNEDEAHLIGDPIETALIHMADASDTCATELRDANERIREIPFSSETKMMGTLHRSGENYFIAAKGSGEHLLKKCNKVLRGGAEIEIGDKELNKILAAAEEMAASGLRVLGFAYSEEIEMPGEDFLESLTFIGMIGFIDPPREDIKEAILMCRKAGIKIVMITGDHPLTALNIAKKVGLVDESEHNFIIGPDMPAVESLTDEWIQKIISTAIFARTTPGQKLDIVSIYQNAGNIVAMTGDGINDAPALKKANIGIAMGMRGTAVAKETASIVLKDDSFTSIEKAVAHGRTIFENIQKFVIYLVSCNLSEIFLVTILGFLAPASTLLPLQILFLNLVTDVFPALALGLGKGDKAVMKRPPRNPKTLLISKKSWLGIYAYAFLISIAVLIAVFYCKNFITSDSGIANNVAFLTLAFAQIFHVFNMSSKRSKFIVNEITKNKFVWIAVVICISLLFMVYAMPQIRIVLGLEVLTAELWLLAVLAGLIPLVIIQAIKLFWRKMKKL